MLAYQLWLPDILATPDRGGVDTFVVSVWDRLMAKEKRVAVQDADTLFFGQNFYPTFSPDGNRLVYMSKRTGEGYELYALPVIGDSIPLDSLTTPTQLTFSNGAMGSGTPPIAQPLAWSPDVANPVLATLDRNGRLRLVPADGSGDQLVVLAGNVSEFKWSPSGGDLLVAVANSLVRVRLSGSTVTVSGVLTAPSGDNLGALSWSSEEEFLLYSVRRLNDIWYEIFDLTGALGLNGPLTVTPSSPVGEALLYSALGSNSPVWSPASEAFMLFFDTGSTPRICKMDFSGLSR
jgi:Tol biopolymer transport system component